LKPSEKLSDIIQKLIEKQDLRLLKAEDILVKTYSSDRPLDNDRTFSDFGLGTSKKKWELKLIPGDPKNNKEIIDSSIKFIEVLTDMKNKEIDLEQKMQENYDNQVAKFQKEKTKLQKERSKLIKNQQQLELKNSEQEIEINETTNINEKQEQYYKKKNRN